MGATLATNSIVGGTDNQFGSVTADDLTLDDGIIVNEDGGDDDSRFESQSNPNFLVLDAGANGGEGQLVIGSAAQGTGNETTYVHIDQPALTAQANKDFARVLIGQTGALTIPSGTAVQVAALRLEEPNITATGTVTDAATLVIEGAPSEGADNHAIWIAADSAPLSIGNAADAKAQWDGTDLLLDYDAQNAGTSSIRIQQNGTDALIIDSNGQPVTKAPIKLDSTNTETLSSDKTLSTTDPQLQYLDPGGAARTVTLPAEESGRAYVIKNTGNSANSITVNDDSGSTVTTLNNQSTAMLISDGTSWGVL